MTFKAIKGIVFNIQRFTLHDGPGIRTELFLKGCTLRCNWCGNPESFIMKREIGVYSSQCIGVSKCGDCIEKCPKGGEKVFSVVDDKVMSINRELCDNCLLCHDECPSDALKMWGRRMSVEDAMKVIRDDKSYYDKSGGGVTISGGEPLMQPQFVREILKECKEEGIHTCVETALNVKTKALDLVMPYTDLVITDIKHLNSDVHEKNTAVGNKLILRNIKKLRTYKKPIIIRIPIIPNVNDREEDIHDIGDFIVNELLDFVVQVQFLRFRPLGEEKYISIGRLYKMEVTEERESFEKHVRNLVEIMVKKGIPAFAGTTNKIDFK